MKLNMAKIALMILALVMMVSMGAVSALAEQTGIVPEEAEAAAPQEAIYIVTFLNWDDSEIFTFTLVAGETVNDPMFFSPVQDGYNFEYWFEGDNAQEAFVFGEPVEKDLIIRPFFSEIETQPAVEPETEAPALEEPIELTAEEEAEDVKVESDDFVLEVIFIDDPDLETEDEPIQEQEQEPEAEIDDEFEAETEAVLDDELEAETEAVLDDELFIIEDDEIPLAGPAITPVDRAVNIHSTLGDCVNLNESVTLTAELIGFEGCDVTLQWQCNDGSGWSDVPGANGMTHSFSATAETVTYGWRVSVIVNG